MSRWQLFKGLIYQPWKVILSILIFIISFYDLMVSQFVEQALEDNYPRVVDILEVIGQPWWAWAILWLILIIVFLFEGSFQYVKRFVEPPELIKLSELRTSGVAMRNKGQTLIGPESVDEWVNHYYVWENEVLNNLEVLSPTKAELWRTLDTFPDVKFPTAVNDKHKLFMAMYYAKLERLRIDIEEISSSIRLGK